MKLISWNVNGIRAIEKKGFLDWLKQENPDILCLQETKAHPSQLNKKLLEPEGYFSYWSAAEKKGYSGVAIYTKSEPESVKEGLGVNEFDSEGRTLMADFGRFVLYNVYFPNGGQGNKRVPFKMAFYETFLQRIDKLKQKGRKVIFCGDVNTAHTEIDLARPKENSNNTGFLPQEREWITKVISRGFVDVFRHNCSDPGHYSWWDYKTKARERDVGWRIDYFFLSENLLSQVTGAGILKDVMGSDHCPVTLELRPKKEGA